MKHGMEGIGVFWSLVEMLYEEGGYMPLEYDRITFELRTDIQIIQSIIKDFDLFENDGSKFWSESVLSRLQERASKSEKARISIQYRWEKYNRNTAVIHPNNELITLEEKKIEKTIKEKKEKIHFETFWDLYDKKVDKEKCETKWQKLTDEEKEECLAKIPTYKISTPDKKFRRDPETYLNTKGWKNEIILPSANNKSNNTRESRRINDLWNQED
jgi:hypothetical protein